MKSVTKRALLTTKEIQEICVSNGAQVLSVCVQHECIWVFFEENVNAYNEFDTSQKIEFAVFKADRQFYTDAFQFLGTVVINFGNDIYHVFYRFV